MKTIAPTIGSPTILPYLVGRKYPPALDKLILWSPGILDSTLVRRDYINDHQVAIIANGDTITNSWDTTLATYSLPNDTALETQDALEGPFWYSTGTPVVHTLSEIELFATSKTATFFCYHNNRGLAIYNQLLTGDELAEVQTFFGCL